MLPRVASSSLRRLATSAPASYAKSKSQDLTEKRIRAKAFNHFEQPNIIRMATKPSQKVPVYRLPQRYPMTRDQIIQIALWLHENLPIRIAKMIMKFQALPFYLAIRPDIREAHELYIQSCNTISLFPKLRGATEEKTWNNVVSFTRTLEEALDNHRDTLRLLISGFSDLPREEEKQIAQEFMNELLGDRLSLRLLCQHQVQIVDEFQSRSSSGFMNKNPEFIGVFHMRFNICKFVESLYAEQQEICSLKYGTNVPELNLNFVKADKNLHLNDNNEFKYISHGLEYILKEILKNSLVAQIQAHKERYGPNSSVAHEKIKILISANKYDVVIKISDKGKGVPHDKVKTIWDYHMTTAGGDENMSFFDMAGGQSSADDKQMCGYGCGLPMSKVYAERMGGSLRMESVQGYGTDVYIRMPYLDNEYLVGSNITSSGKKQDIYEVLKL